MISVHSCVRGRILDVLPQEWRFRCIHVWGVGFRCIYLRDDDFGAFMCDGSDSGAFAWRMMISVHSCVRGKIPVHLPEGWWFRSIHVWGVGFRCIYLRDDNDDAFMCDGSDSGALAWRMMISVPSCVRGKISVHLPEGGWFRCIHVWGVGVQCIQLRDDDFGAFMCDG